MRLMSPPIFCDECPAFAVALMDDRFLCMECLLAAVGREPSMLERGAIRSLPTRLTSVGGEHDAIDLSDLVDAMKADNRKALD